MKEWQTRSKEEYLTIRHLPLMGLGMLCIVIGFAIANKIVDRLDGEKIKRITYVVIGISGIMNVIPAVFPWGVMAVALAEPVSDLLTTFCNKIYFDRFLMRKLSKSVKM